MAPNGRTVEREWPRSPVRSWGGHTRAVAACSISVDEIKHSPGAGKLRRIMRGDEPVSSAGSNPGCFISCARRPSAAQTNRLAGGRRVDCRWPVHRLTVELDSYRYHRPRHAWEQDPGREREAHARGDDFRRYTHDDLFEEPRLMLRELHGLL